MCNIEIREAISESGLKYWQVADALHIADTTFTKWLRKELDPAKKRTIMSAIESLKEEMMLND